MASYRLGQYVQAPTPVKLKTVLLNPEIIIYRAYRAGQFMYVVGVDRFVTRLGMNRFTDAVRAKLINSINNVNVWWDAATRVANVVIHGLTALVNVIGPTGGLMPAYVQRFTVYAPDDGNLVRQYDGATTYMFGGMFAANGAMFQKMVKMLSPNTSKRVPLDDMLD